MAYGVLRPKDATGATFLDIRHTNTTGTLISATPTLDGSGREIGDQYTLTASAVVLGSPNTCTITVTTASTLGPYDAVYTGVVCDGATTRNDIVPGVVLTFTGSGSLANGWASVVYVGLWAGLITAGNPAGSRLSWATGIGTPGTGSVSPGAESFIAKILMTNTGATVLTGCTMALYPRAKLVQKSGARAFNSVQVVNSSPTEHVSSTQIQPINFTFANLDTAATPDEIDVVMDGVSAFDVLEVDSGTALTSTQLKMDSATRYQITEAGAYCLGMIFTLATTATNTSAENVLIFNVRHVEIALDVAGSPGTWGTSALTLTQSGEPSGNINPAGAVAVWLRIDTSSLASNKQNPFPGDFFIEYNDTGEADWLA